MEDFTPYTALLGGVLIGLSVTLLLLFNGRIAGISGIMQGLLKPFDSENSWRIYFIGGLLLGALFFQYFSLASFSPRQDYPLWMVASGGFLVGIGTRLGNGCTSGHGIHGLAAFSKLSLLAPICFISFSMLTVFS